MKELIKKIRNEIQDCNERLKEINNEVDEVLDSYKNGACRKSLMDLHQKENQKSAVRDRLTIYKKVERWIEEQCES